MTWNMGKIIVLVYLIVGMCVALPVLAAKPAYQMALSDAQIVRSADGQHSIEVYAKCIVEDCWYDLDDVLFYDPESGDDRIDTGTDGYYIIDASGQRYTSFEKGMDVMETTVVLQLLVPDTTKSIGIGMIDDEQSAAIPLETKSE